MAPSRDMVMQILLPRFVNATNTNAQNLNGRALLARFNHPDITWRSFYNDVAASDVSHNPRVRLTKLFGRRLWQWHVVLQYQKRVDAIVYPGVEWFDVEGLRLRARLGRRVPVVATLEGLAGDGATEARLSAAAGHPVYCQRVDGRVRKRISEIMAAADHVVAISPFLARMGKVLYGDKFSVLPLGVDTGMFHVRMGERPLGAVTVASAGSVVAHKRPRTFLEMATRFPKVRFRWYGEGSDRARLISDASARRVSNIEFPGAKSPAELAKAFRQSDIFVLPSLSEGVPKVTLEAAACGLPVIAFGFYEPPSIIDAKTGFLVWSDQELEARLSQLIEDQSLRRELGANGRELARSGDWDIVASLWESRIVELVRQGIAC